MFEFSKYLFSKFSFCFSFFLAFALSRKEFIYNSNPIRRSETESVKIRLKIWPICSGWPISWMEIFEKSQIFIEFQFFLAFLATKQGIDLYSVKCKGWSKIWIEWIMSIRMGKYVDSGAPPQRVAKQELSLGIYGVIEWWYWHSQRICWWNHPAIFSRKYYKTIFQQNKRENPLESNWESMARIFHKKTNKKLVKMGMRPLFFRLP